MLSRNEHVFPTALLDPQDTDRNEKIDFEEYYLKMILLAGEIQLRMTTLFTGFDGNAEKQGILQMFSLKLLEMAIMETYYFFSFIHNTTTLIERYKTGEVTEDISALIILPGPAYAFYSLLDMNDNLSQDEAIDFLQHTMNLIDSNYSCVIDLNDFFALAVKVWLSDNSTAKMTDWDNISKVTLEEVSKQDDASHQFMRNFYLEEEPRKENETLNDMWKVIQVMKNYIFFLYISSITDILRPA